MPDRQDKVCARCKSADIVRILEGAEFQRVRYNVIYDTVQNIHARATQCRICYILAEWHQRRYGTVSHLCKGQDEFCCLRQLQPRDLLDVQSNLDLPNGHYPRILQVLFSKCEDTCNSQQGSHNEYCRNRGTRYIIESQEPIDEHDKLRAVETSILSRAETESVTKSQEKVHLGDTFEVAFEGPRWSLSQHEDHSASSISIDYQDWKLEKPPANTPNDAMFTIQLDATSPNSTNLNLSLNHFSTTHSPNIDFPSLKCWIASCEETHPTCDRATKPLNCSEEQGKIRCVNVECLQIVPLTVWDRYVALSYVWGDPSKSNEIRNGNSAYPPSIQFENLPQTIQDAISATRALGEQYLWVDALCINQDDEKDVKEQIRKMGLIFENACFTIVASATNSSFKGISRFKRARRDVVLFNAVIGKARVVFKSQKSWIGEVFDQTWITRGWTYQEALLSRRCLFFGEFRVVFYCRENLGLESILPPHILLDNTFASAVKYVTARYPRKYYFPFAFNFVAAEWDFKRYRDLLEDYTKRTFSYQQDFLNAFSGVLAKFEETTGQTFVFGLPRDDLVNGLLWSPSEPDPVANGLFPTWTWANCPRSNYYVWDSPVQKLSGHNSDNQIGVHESTQTQTETDRSVLVHGTCLLSDPEATRGRIVQIEDISMDNRTIFLETELRDLSVGLETANGRMQYAILDEKTKIPVATAIGWNHPKVKSDRSAQYIWSAFPPIRTPTEIDCASKVKAILIVEWEFARQEAPLHERTLFMVMLIRFLQNGNAERIGLAAVPSSSWQHAVLIGKKEKIRLV